MVATGTRNVKQATAQSPCPHCSKPDWCYTLDNLTVCKRGNPPATGWRATSKQDSEGSFFYAPDNNDTFIKPIRKAQKREWLYSGRDGKPLVKVVREDFSEPRNIGGKLTHRSITQKRHTSRGWVNGLDGIKREDIPVLRLGKVREAIAAGEKIFVVEGEPCVVAMEGLGLVATTNIGGSTKWRPSDSNDLIGASVVLCPDRDKPGTKHMDLVAESLEGKAASIEWLYCYPTSPIWNNLPASGGADVEDWLRDYNELTQIDVAGAIVPSPRRCEWEAEEAPSQPDTSKMDIVDTQASVAAILGLGLIEPDEVHELSKIFELSELSKEAFWSLVKSERLKADTVFPEDRVRLEELFNQQKRSIDWDYSLPHLAKDLKRSAKALSIDPMAIWNPLLPTGLSLLGNRVKVDAGSFRVFGNAYVCTVGKSGSGKSRGDNLVLDPIRRWQSEEKKAYKQRLEDYEAALEEYKTNKEADADDKPSEPKPEVKRLFNVATIQSVARRASGGVLWARDEIAGLVKSLSQFSGKKDNEGLEILLELWDHSQIIVDRVRDEDSFVSDDIALSLYGGIQPKALKLAFADADDTQGWAARFLFAEIEAKPWTASRGYAPLADVLPDLYRFLRDYPETTLKLSDKAFDRYAQFGSWAWQESERLKANPAIDSWMKKLVSQMLRIALLLHCIEGHFDKRRQIDEIQEDTILRAVSFAKYYADTYQSLLEVAQAETTVDLGAIMMRLWDEARQKDGLTARDAYRAITPLQKLAKEAGVSASTYTNNLFSELVEQGKGELRRDERNSRITRFYALLEAPTTSPDDDRTELQPISDLPTSLEADSQPDDNGVCDVVEQHLDRAYGEPSPDVPIVPGASGEGATECNAVSQISENTAESGPLIQPEIGMKVKSRYTGKFGRIQGRKVVDGLELWHFVSKEFKTWMKASDMTL